MSEITNLKKTKSKANGPYVVIAYIGKERYDFIKANDLSPSKLVQSYLDKLMAGVDPLAEKKVEAPARHSATTHDSNGDPLPKEESEKLQKFASDFASRLKESIK